MRGVSLSRLQGQNGRGLPAPPFDFYLAFQFLLYLQGLQHLRGFEVSQSDASVGSAGRPVDFDQYQDVHLPAVILKTFLRELPEPLLTFRVYTQVQELLGESEC